MFQTASWYQANQTYDSEYVSGYGLIDAHAASLFTPPIADLNEDFFVNVSDLLQLLAAWGDCAPSGSCLADFNSDGQVSVSDLLAMLADWG